MRVFKVDKKQYYLLAEAECDTKKYALFGNIEDPYDQFIKICKDGDYVSLSSEEEMVKAANLLLKKLESSV